MGRFSQIAQLDAELESLLYIDSFNESLRTLRPVKPITTTEKSPTTSDFACIGSGRGQLLAIVFLYC